MAVGVVFGDGGDGRGDGAAADDGAASDRTGDGAARDGDAALGALDDLAGALFGAAVEQAATVRSTHAVVRTGERANRRGGNGTPAMLARLHAVGSCLGHSHEEDVRWRPAPNPTCSSSSSKRKRCNSS
jgi:hypothetical protein